jgi:predicted ATPase
MTDHLCVGREEEIRQLYTLFESSLRGDKQLCFITGEAGLGKTTLVNSFIEQINETHPTTIVALGECNGQAGITDPYLPFRDVLDMLTGITESKTTPKKLGEKNTSRIKEFALTSFESLLELGPDLIGSVIPGGILAAKAIKVFADKSKVLQRLKDRVNQTAIQPASINEVNIFQQYTAFLQSLSKNNSLVIVLDDLHWADNASISLLFHLARRIERGHLFIIGTYRPNEVSLERDGNRHPLEPVLNEIKRYYGNIWVDLAKETEHERKEFVDALVDSEPNHLNDDFRKHLFAKTEGNTLFTMELLRDLKERRYLIKDQNGFWIEGKHLQWGTLPTKVEGVIEERIMRLEQQLRDALVHRGGNKHRVFDAENMSGCYRKPVEDFRKRVLAIASVEGENFTAQVIGRLQKLDERQVFRNLSAELEKRHQLIQENGEIKVGERILSFYKFAHILFQQYLYNGLGVGERRALHKEIASILEILYEGHTEDISAQLARHFEEASLPEKAITYLNLAGQKAFRIGAFLEARSFFAKATSLEIPSTELKIELFRKLGEVCYEIREFSIGKSSLEKSVHLSRSINASKNLSLGLSLLGRLMVEIGENHKARELLLESVEVARALGDNEILARALNELAYVLVPFGEFAEAKKLYEEILALVPDVGNSPIPHVFYDMSNCVYYLNDDYTEAKQLLKESIKAAKTARNPILMAYTFVAMGWYLRDEENYLEAKQYYNEALKLAEDSGDPWTAAEAYTGLGLVACELADYSSSWSYYRKAIRIMASDDTGSIPQLLYTLVELAKLSARQGKWELAFELLEISTRHSSSNREIELYAEKILAEVNHLLPQRQQAPSKKVESKDLGEVIALLLEEDNPTGKGAI